MARATVPLNFNAFLEKVKLKDDGSNYTDWVRNLRIILIAAQKSYVLDVPLGARPAAGATPDVMNVWQSKADDYSIVQCAMLYGLEPGLQRRFENHGAYEMFQELKLIFQQNVRIERYEVSNKFYSCKMEENGSVSEHILRMSGYYNHLSQLGVNLPDDCVIDRILQSLPPSYKGFVMNYNMQGLVKTMPELFAMLKAAEVEIEKEHQVLMVNKTTSFKKRAKGRRNGTSRRTISKLLLKRRNPSLDLSLKLSASTASRLVTGSGTAPSIWRIRRMARSTKVYMIYMLLMCTLPMLTVAPGYLILVLLLIFATQNRGYGLSEDWLRTR